MLCITSAMRVRVQNGMICSPTLRVVCPRHTQAVWWAKRPFWAEPLRGRGFAGNPLRCKTRQGVRLALGFAPRGSSRKTHAARGASYAEHPYRAGQ